MQITEPLESFTLKAKLFVLSVCCINAIIFAERAGVSVYVRKQLEMEHLMFLNLSAALSQVEILAGKDKGKQGKVIQVFRHRNWVILEGLNTVRKAYLLS